MKSKSYTVIGVMSGTSKDGIDLAYIQLTPKGEKWKYTFLSTDTLPYTTAWEKRLEEADQLSQTEVKQLDITYTSYLAQRINRFIQDHKITTIDAICSHGHTVFHQPEIKYTLQIGNLPQIATLLNKKVVCDFRTADVLMGGQGAPLVPQGDRILFSNYAACLNLGGFANISFEKENIRVAYDICAVNTVLNHYANQLGVAYDDKGKIARAGKPHSGLMQELQNLPFYQKTPPKSLGIEWVKEKVIPLLDTYSLSPQEILATYTRHIARILAKALPQEGKVLVTGGGAFNDFLIERMRKNTTSQVILPDQRLINYKEALVFGLLGVLRLRNENNVLKSVTGAPMNHSAGIIFEPSS